MRALTALLACATNTYALDPSLRRRWQDAPIAQVAGGKVRGITTKDNVTAFYGVPYAKAKRYADAAPTSWSGIRDATAPAPPCPQMAHGVIGHEDCLVANVFTAGIPNAPVMLQIHGGSMNAGRAVADGAALAERAKAVIVSIQYRLGALGFWAANASAPQNFGLDDLLFALRWARDNADAFGGDPQRVMVFGVSAGGAAVAHLLTTAPPGLIFSATICVQIKFRTPHAIILRIT